MNQIAISLKDYHKAIKYAEQCLTLDRRPECKDWLINFWLADLYNRTGDIDKSRSRLTAALKLDIGNRIENGGWIERYELQAIYEQIPEEIIQLPNDKLQSVFLLRGLEGVTL